MTEGSPNVGVVIGGSSHVSGPVAGGKGAQAHQNGAPNAAAIEGELRLLESRIDFYRDQLTDMNEFVRRLNSVRTELAQPEERRDKGVILRALTWIQENTTEVATICTVADGIRRSIGA